MLFILMSAHIRSNNINNLLVLSILRDMLLFLNHCANGFISFLYVDSSLLLMRPTAAISLVNLMKCLKHSRCEQQWSEHTALRDPGV